MKYVVRRIEFSPYNEVTQQRHVISSTDKAWFDEYHTAREYADFKNSELPPVYRWRNDLQAIIYAVNEI